MTKFATFHRGIRRIRFNLSRQHLQWTKSPARTEAIAVFGAVLLGMLLVLCFCTMKPKVHFIPPVLGWNHCISSDLGERENPTGNGLQDHQGIDFAVDEGTSIFSVADGVVLTAKEGSVGYGNHLVITHRDGWQTLYAHCSDLLVSEGQTVTAGQVIALSGTTGDSTGPHLHFELSKNGKLKDIKQYLSKTNDKVEE